MRKLVLIFLVALYSGFAFAQTTATNFTANDCAGTSHDLFADLNNGKIVVLVWVMPCGSCIGPALSAYTEVKKINGAYPGRVLYYLVDDFANTTCPTLVTWGRTNGIVDIPAFSNAAIKMSDYGSAGMPKIVALAGNTHEIIFNQSNGLDATNFKTAINQRIATGIDVTAADDFAISVFPNPVTGNKTIFRYSVTQESGVSIDIYNILGEVVKTILLEQQSSGKHETELDLSLLQNGLYYIKSGDGKKTRIAKIIINR